MSSDDIKFPHLDSDLLRTFQAVARAGSMSEELLAMACGVIETLDRTVATMRRLEDRGEIRLGVPEEYGDTILPSILSAFAQAEPRAGILLRCGSSADFPHMLADGKLDLILHSPEKTFESDIIVHSEKAVWCGSDVHDVQDRRPLPVSLFDKTCWWRDRCLHLLQTSRLDYQIVCTSESVAGVRAAIASGTAIGVLPQSAMTDRLGILPEAALPHIGETELVLTRAADAPARLTKRLTRIIIETFRKQLCS